MYAGQTLAQLAAHASTDPAGVRAELQARIDRNGKSAKNARLALERMDAGASVAIPARPAKATPAAAPKGTKSPQTLAIAQAVAARTAARGPVTQAQACKLAADLLRASGYPVPRALTTLARGRALKVRTQA